MLLRNSQFKGSVTFEEVIDLANESVGKDVEGYREEFVSVKKAAKLNSTPLRNDRI